MKKLILLAIPALLFALFSFATPVRAGILGDLWDGVQCVADINCTITAAATASQNFIFRVILGKEAEGQYELEDNDLKEMKKGTWTNGLAGAASTIGAMAYNYPPPVHLADYIRYEFSDTILSSPAQAQETFGTFFLSPIREFWSAMRNIAYGLFLVLMVITGFMIMFRTSVSPRVVVTFTNALPRIVLGLVLITFSFPIIGFIIDIGAVFASELIGGIVITQFSQIPDITAISSAADAVSAILPVVLSNLIGTLKNVFTNPPQVIISLIIMNIFALTAMVIFVLTLGRVLISYAWLLIYTLFSPLLILFGSLPGQEGKLADLGKKIVAKTLVFPSFVFFVGLGLFFASGAIFGDVDFSLELGRWGNLSTALQSSELIFSAGVLGSLLSLVMLAAAWKAPAMIEDALGVGGKPPKKK